MPRGRPAADGRPADSVGSSLSCYAPGAGDVDVHDYSSGIGNHADLPR